MTGKISLFKKIDDDLFEKAGIQTEIPHFSYTDLEDGEETFINFDEREDSYVLNEMEPEWSPIEHNLTIQQKITIDCPENLFGEDGVTHEDNVLGIAVNYYSKTSNFQRTVKIGTIKNSSDRLTLMFDYTFDENMLRGALFFEYFIYLKEVHHKLPFTSSMIGANLNDEFLDLYSVIIDGRGSEFPIEEIADKGEPLWRVTMNWTDVYEDLFDSSTIRLILNREHPVFDSLVNKNNKNRINRYLMNEIIISAMSLIVQKAILIDKEEIESESEFNPGTIAQVIWYWISTYDLKLDSLESISHSFHRGADIFIGDDK